MTRHLILKFALASIMVFGFFNQSLAADVEAGEIVAKKCLMCHSTEEGQNKIGPSLFGVVGRVPGSMEGFRYSPAMTAFGEGKTWTDELLDEYLTSPRLLIPGNRMGFAGIPNATDRENLIEYLKTLK